MDKVKAKSISMESVFEHLGFTDVVMSSNMKCPVHGDKVASAQSKVTIDKTGNECEIFTCHKCGVTALDNIGLVQWVKNLSFVDAMKWFEMEYGDGMNIQGAARKAIVGHSGKVFSKERKGNPQVFQKVIEKGVSINKPVRGILPEILNEYGIRVYPSKVREGMFNYLMKECGFELESLKRCGVVRESGLGGYFFSDYKMIIPYYDKGDIVSIEARFPENRDFLGKEYEGIGNPKSLFHSPKSLYNINVLKELKEGDELFIQEGVWDTLSLIQLGKKVVGLAGAGTFKNYADLFKPFKVKMILDNNPAGNDLGELAKKHLPNVELFTWNNKVIDYDVNSWLKENPSASFDDMLNELENNSPPLGNDMVDLIQSEFDLSQSVKEGELLGLKMSNWKELEKHLDGLQMGVYAVGGSTFVGKTGFLTNVMVEILTNNDNACVLFFSFDLGKFPIVRRIRSCLGDVKIWEVAKKQVDEMIEGRKKEINEILVEWGRNKRFFISDTSTVSNFNDVFKVIEEFHTPYNKLVVFLDGANYISIPNKTGLEKDEELLIQMERIRNKYKCPVFATLEMRKRARAKNGEDMSDDDYYKHQGCIEDFKGSITIPYKSDVTIILHPNESGWLDRTKQFVNYAIYVNKNRVSGMAGRFDFIYDKWNSKLRESNTDGKKVKRALNDIAKLKRELEKESLKKIEFDMNESIEDDKL